MTTIISKSGIGVPLPEKLETAELAVDTTNGNLYTKLDDGSVVHLNDAGEGGDGTGSSVHIGEAPPAGPQEGQQWMEVPADGDATMWIYDGDKWLQQPGGKDGAPGADGNIQDATEDGVIATWDNTAGQWTPEGAVVVDANGNVGIGTDSVDIYSQLHVANSIGGIMIEGAGNNSFAQLNFKTPEYAWNIGMRPEEGQKLVVRNALNGTIPMTIDANGENGRVDITGSLYVNGTPKIGTVDLIKAFSKLRDAVKDEETVESLKESITNCIGGLIEEWESMQSPATQEISDE